MTTRFAPLADIKFRAMLVVFTLGIWGSRMRNIQADVELTGTERGTSLGIAFAFLAAATITGAAVLREADWARVPLLSLVALGIVRWTVRGPLILLSDEWEMGFKVVHTVLWFVTVVLSALAWREHRVASSS